MVTREQEIADLQRKLRAREGRPGFAANVAEIRKRRDELREGQADAD